MWFVRSITPVDRVRFVRNHLRRGVRFDSHFRMARFESVLDSDVERDDAMDQTATANDNGKQ